MGKNEEILELIRELSRKNPEGHATALEIFDSARSRRIIGKSDIESRKLRFILTNLKNQGRIRDSPYKPFAWIPESWSPSKAKPEKAEIDEIKVKDTIKEFFMEKVRLPTPNEIAEKYIQTYGQVNVESLTRFVRRMHEMGILKRTEKNAYYFDGLLRKDEGLRRFG